MNITVGLYRLLKPVLPFLWSNLWDEVGRKAHQFWPCPWNFVISILGHYSRIYHFHPCCLWKIPNQRALLALLSWGKGDRCHRTMFHPGWYMSHLTQKGQEGQTSLPMVFIHAVPATHATVSNCSLGLFYTCFLFYLLHSSSPFSAHSVREWGTVRSIRPHTILNEMTTMCPRLGDSSRLGSRCTHWQFFRYLKAGWYEGKNFMSQSRAVSSLILRCWLVIVEIPACAEEIPLYSRNVWAFRSWVFEPTKVFSTFLDQNPLRRTWVNTTEILFSFSHTSLSFYLDWKSTSD